MFHKKMKISERKGMGLVPVLIGIAISGALLEETVRAMKNQNNMLMIMRMNQRLTITSEWVASVGNSSVALQKSAEYPENSVLTSCFIQKNCSGSDTREPFTLYDSFGQKVSGIYHLDGQECEPNQNSCPISIETKISFDCPDSGASCVEPDAIHVFYVVQKNPQLERTDILFRRDFKKFESEVIIANFSCPKGEYIRAIADNGALQCAPPRFSAGKEKCDGNMAPTGVLANGMISDCVTVENFCKKPLAIATVLDVSGSMSGTKINVARNVLQNFISSFDDARDIGTLTTFSTKAKAIVASTKDRSHLKGEAKKQVPEGSTNMGEGLTMGGASLAGEKGRSKIMIFLSDGMNNTGDLNIGAIADNLKSQGIRIVTIGFGSAADQVALRRIASPGDNFAAPKDTDLSGVFDSIQSVLCR